MYQSYMYQYMWVCVSVLEILSPDSRCINRRCINFNMCIYHPYMYQQIHHPRVSVWVVGVSIVWSSQVGIYQAGVSFTVSCPCCYLCLVLCQALIYPLMVACKSSSPARQNAANKVLTSMCEHSSTLVQQAMLVSTAKYSQVQSSTVKYSLACVSKFNCV